MFSRSHPSQQSNSQRMSKSNDLFEVQRIGQCLFLNDLLLERALAACHKLQSIRSRFSKRVWPFERRASMRECLMPLKKFMDTKVFEAFTVDIFQMCWVSVWQHFNCITTLNLTTLYSFIGIIPYAGIDLAVYETLKKKYLAKHTEQQGAPPIYLLLACGSVSSTLGQVCSYPLALVRTRLQAQGTLKF